MKILSRDEYFDIRIDDDSIACIYLVDNYNAKSFIWTIEHENHQLQLLNNVENKDDQTLINALIRTPRMMIDDYVFNLVVKANVTLLETVNKKDFLRFLDLHEWTI
jgi:hypothetical protein